MYMGNESWQKSEGTRDDGRYITVKSGEFGLVFVARIAENMWRMHNVQINIK